MKLVTRSILLSPLLVAALAGPAAGASLTVSKTTDDGSAGTLRSALARAGPGDVIGFSTPGPIVLGSALPAVGPAVDIEGCAANPNATGSCVTVAASSSFDGLDVAGDGAVVRGVAITGAAVGIRVSGSNVSIGGSAPATENAISGSAGAAIAITGAATGVVIDRNLGSGNGGPFIQLAPGANGDAAPPAILAASDAAVSGTAPPGAVVRLFASLGPGEVDGFAGAATADASGAWAIPAVAAPGEYLAATETGGSGSSALSGAVVAVHASGAPPTGTIQRGPPRFGNRSSVRFRFTVPPGTTRVACAVDDRRFATCRSPYASGYLLDGRHVFHLRTSDAAGAPAIIDSVFTIDTLPPAVSLGGVHVRVSPTGGAPAVTFTVSCPPSEPGGCSGTLGVGTVPDPKTHRYQVVGRVSWKAPPNNTVRVAIPVPPWTIALSRHGRGLLVRVALLARDDAGNVTQIRRNALILPPSGTAAAYRSRRHGSRVRARRARA